MPPGVKPVPVITMTHAVGPLVGEIAEILMVSQDVAKKLRFYDPTQVPDFDTVVNRQLTPDEEAVQWRNREMTSRLCWKPYFHNPKLPAYLRGVKVPTLIVWGRQDAIVPGRAAVPGDHRAAVPVLRMGDVPVYRHAHPDVQLDVPARAGSVSAAGAGEGTSRGGARRRGAARAHAHLVRAIARARGARGGMNDAPEGVEQET